MLKAFGSKRTGSSTTSVRSPDTQSPTTFMFAAKSLDLQLTNEKSPISNFANSDHYAVLLIDEKPVPKPGYQTPMPSPRWPSFRFNISSMLTIAIFRKRRWHKDSLVAQYTGQGRDFLDRDTKYALTDKSGSQSELYLNINIDMVSISPAEFIKSVKENASRLQSGGTLEAAQAIGALSLHIFQILENIVPAIDAIADAHPVLKMTWTILSSVYKAIKRQMDEDDAVCDLARSLQEILGVANMIPELVRIQDTDDVITEIRRAALEGALLIAEYVGTTSLAARTATQRSGMAGRITQCQKRYTDLGHKFDRRVQLETNATVKGIQDVQMEGNIKTWMNAPDTSPTFNVAQSKHTPDTGSWFLNGPAFTRWKNDPDILLWLRGGPGCGKTILCAATIKYIIDFCHSKSSTSHASFFFDGSSAIAAHLVHEKLIRSIIMQLSHQHDGIPIALAEMYVECEKGSRQPPIGFLETTLLRIVDGFDDVYIIIDSLDECSERLEVVRWIQSIAKRASGKLHVAVSSRPEPEIMHGLQTVSQREEIVISGSQNEPDVRSYLNTRLSQPDADDWTDAQKDMIKGPLIDGADGVFRWVALQADQLIKSPSPQELKTRLNSLPPDLNASYSKILAESTDPSNLKRLLQWLAYSKRPLTIEEIAEVAAINFGDNDSGVPMFSAEGRFKNPDYVLALCYGLVTEVEVNIESQSWKTPILKRGVKLAHFSVKEYLLSEHILSGAATYFHTDEQLSHAMIAQTSLAYLLHFDKSDSLSLGTLPLFPLSRYAAEHWAAHFRDAGSNHGNAPALQQMLHNFFAPSPSYALHNCLFLHDDITSDHGVKFDHEASKDFGSVLYYACHVGVTTVVANLIDNGADVNDNSGLVEAFPLIISSWMGHLEITRLLLEHGADVQSGSPDNTALHMAMVAVRPEIIRLLVEHGADIETSLETINGTALNIVSSGGHLEIVRFLLERGAKVEGGGSRGTPLKFASSGGHIEIVQLLLAHGANVHAKSGSHQRTALAAASSKGHVAIVKLLREHVAVAVEVERSDSDSTGLDSGVAASDEADFCFAQ